MAQSKEDITVRGEPLEVFSALQLAHVGKVIKSIAFDHSTNEVVVVLHGVKGLVLENHEWHFLHHSIHLAHASVFGVIDIGLQTINTLKGALHHEFDDASWTAYQDKLDAFFQPFGDEAGWLEDKKPDLPGGSSLN